MGAILNGIALHRGLRPFGSTFLVFSDYMRPAIRLAALMRLPVVFLFTHDSVGLGEDGPTHQPIEHLPSLRLIPNLAVLRPADAHETAWAWATAVRRGEGPTALVLSRQALPVLAPTGIRSLDEVGARVVHEPPAPPAAVVIATGSEVAVALEAAHRLEGAGIPTRVVSMPWRERFLDAESERRAALLPPGVARVAIEAAHPLGWEAVVGDAGGIIGISRFGASAPGDRVLRELGINAERVVEQVLTLVARTRTAATDGARRTAATTHPIASR